MQPAAMAASDKQEGATKARPARSADPGLRVAKKAGEGGKTRIQVSNQLDVQMIRVPNLNRFAVAKVTPPSDCDSSLQENISLAATSAMERAYETH